MRPIAENTDLKLDWREWLEQHMAFSPDSVQGVWMWADHAKYFGELVTLSPIRGRARVVGFTDPSNETPLVRIMGTMLACIPFEGMCSSYSSRSPNPSQVLF